MARGIRLTATDILYGRMPRVEQKRQPWRPKRILPDRLFLESKYFENVNGYSGCAGGWWIAKTDELPPAWKQDLCVVTAEEAREGVDAILEGHADPQEVLTRETYFPDVRVSGDNHCMTGEHAFSVQAMQAIEQTVAAAGYWCQKESRGFYADLVYANARGQVLGIVHGTPFQ